MNEDQRCLLTTAIALTSALRLFIATRKEYRQQRVNRRFWMQSSFYNRANTKETVGKEPRRNEAINDTLSKHVRLSREDFSHLFELLKPRITKMDTTMRTCISPLERLCITLRFLATGDSYMSLSTLFHISRQSISKIIPEVCDAIAEVLKDYVVLPSTNAQWLEVAGEFEQKWNYPHVAGAIDGRHVAIIAPKNRGAEYFNHKYFHSIALLGIVDASYNFMYVDVGCAGSISDGGGILAKSSIFNNLENGTLNIPEATILRPPYEVSVPYMLLGDNTFELSNYMLTPFEGATTRNSPESVFNYRHGRARRTVENAFGILTNVFGVLHKAIILEPCVAEKIILATVYLHNYSLKSNSRDIYMPIGSIDREVDGHIVSGSWRNDMPILSMHPLSEIPQRPAPVIQRMR
uniref:DDE Tnp4 domain-containing protein n=1 Tax=Anopheles atroparvus TaxID=41427 RepID=A0AAG5DNT5_ANOAO